MKKRLLALLLALVMVCGLMPAASAVSDDDAAKAAQILYDLGLFQGTGTNADGTPNFDLTRTPTRAEAVTMLVRLLGKDEEAKAGTWTTPFTDVDEWAKPYVGYAYANGLTTGTSATTFGGRDTVNVTQYLTFALRALGYRTGLEFQWDKAWEKSDALGLTNGEYNAETQTFTRGDIALISEKALMTTINWTTKSLLKRLLDEETVTQEQIRNSALPIEPKYSDLKFVGGWCYYLKEDGKTYNFFDGIHEYSSIFNWAYNYYTGQPYCNGLHFGQLYALCSESYKESILSDLSPYNANRYADGAIADFGDTPIRFAHYVGEYKDQYRDHIEFSLREKVISFQLGLDADETATEIFQKTGVYVLISPDTSNDANIFFNVYDLFDFFEVEPEIREKFENIRFEVDGNGKGFVIVD